MWTGSSHWGGVGGGGRKPETGIIYIYIYLVGGFNFNPFEKYAQVKLDHETPNIRGEISKTIFELPPTYLDVPGRK